MDIQGYLSGLAEKYTAYFDVEWYKAFSTEKMDIFATSRVENVKYILTNKLPVWRCETNEYCMVKSFENQVRENDFTSFKSFLKENMVDIVKPHSDHMYSIITGCIVSKEGFEDEVIKLAGKYKLRKNFLFTLHGWCDVRLVLVDLADGQVYGSKGTKDVLEFYKPEQNESGTGI
ncbi:MAG: hypothetical protein K9L17_01000 [Clostridiales bacterium]|nr:hypothetical protein [Clostridiales bacterium]MCF8021270.1 hypothetical protein [Clostridiales bacterium]